ncbi:MAG: NAD(P)H-hydrate dehydratase [Deltaproteobacteria bacterium]|nr:NAD(P)H-hydrate dehydratase [Deltaproteobacteria bacterium]
MLLVTSQQSQALDRFSEDAGVSIQTLMQKAGVQIAATLEKNINSKADHLVFFVGKGNNGGDGLVAGDILSQKGFQTIVVRNEEDLKNQKEKFKKVCWIVDGLLGTGIKGEVRGWMHDAIEWINHSGKKVLSIDIPSGLSADKGIPLGVAVKADKTVCLGFVKLGVVLYPGLEFAGEVSCVDIGIPKDAVRSAALNYHLLEPSDFEKILKPRPKNCHKKDFGHVLVIAGSRGMPGAGFLSSQACLRVGAGLVTYALPSKAFEKFESDFSEVMVQEIPDEGKGFFTLKSVETVLKLCEKKDAVVLGPGLGRAPETVEFVQKIVNQIPCPLILDADGLYGISTLPSLLKKRPASTVLTPHPGEMATLLGWQTQEVQKTRIAVTLDAAKLWQCSVLLKGFRSLVALKNGDLYVNPTGNPGMATAGMGDVLSGVIGGLVAQGADAELATLAGVYLHGFAGDLAVKEQGEKGLIASDVLRYLPKAILIMQKSKIKL